MYRFALLHSLISVLVLFRNTVLPVEHIEKEEFINWTVAHDTC